ncbi:MAG TPA: response regulator [Blastocatellia bacterium]|nr:response regulator [Blastocatellia bacterium]
MMGFQTHSEHRKILLVEDMDDSRFMLKRLLEMEGFQVTEADDGPGALEALRDDNFDALLLDLRLPRMDGFQLTRALRANDSYQSLPIIIVSALDDEFSRTEARAAGCTDYLSKPIDFDRLTVMLNKYLSTSYTTC